MRVLFIGDIVGRPGRECLKKILPLIVAEHKPDCVIANGENAAGGAGITLPVFKELKELGIDLVTGGNHIWDNKDVLQFIDTEDSLIRPANYPRGTTPGQGSTSFGTRSGQKIGLVNLSGRVYMQPMDCPFKTGMDAVVALKKVTAVVLVDFHAEATAEKQAMGWHLDGKVSAVLGTHTHVQTADERILPLGTAYITDAGMTGLHDSILGVDRKEALHKFTTGLPARYKISKGAVQFNGVLLEIDESTGKSQAIIRINEVIP